MRSSMVARRVVVSVMLIAACAVGVRATETDQFTMPRGMVFADLGTYFTRNAMGYLQEGIDELNSKIKKSLRNDPSGKGAQRYYRSFVVARIVRDKIPSAVPQIEELEHIITSPSMQQRYPGRIIGYKPGRSIFSVRSAFDIGKPFTWHFSATIRIGDVYLGTDKIGHFYDKGYILARRYYEGVGRGDSTDEANADAIQLGVGGNIIYSEDAILGMWSSGIYSNADLACDYAGMLFFRNLTEPVEVAGMVREPMLVRDGAYWTLADHVRLDSDFLTRFFTDHFNEALNPSVYRGGFRKTVHNYLAKHADDVLDWYADENGTHRSQAWFQEKVDDLSTYYGVDYGYRGDDETLVTIASACFATGETPAFQSTAFQPIVVSDASTGSMMIGSPGMLSRRDTHGATMLYRVVDHPRIVERLITHGAPVGAADNAGRTPLHAAARVGAAETIDLLIAGGASVDAVDHKGWTPLHDAARHGHAEAAARLLAHGARVDVVVRLGMTPLHLAALQDEPGVVGVLAGAGADLSARDATGWSAMHHAASHGNGRIIAALLDAGADGDAQARGGERPIHLACRTGGYACAMVLARAGADLDAPEARGMTPLHEAAYSGSARLVGGLIDLGADPTGGGAATSPAELARQRGHRRAAALLWQAIDRSGS